MQADKRLEKLYHKWIYKKATPEEEAELFSLLNTDSHLLSLESSMENLWNDLTDDDQYDIEKRHALADTILTQWPAQPVISINKAKSFRLHRVWLAAAGILLIAGAAFFWKNFAPVKNQQALTQQMAPLSLEAIEPGKEGAILTLADGTQVVLDSTGNGIISSQGNAQIRLQDNKLVYQADGNITGDQPVAYNSMTTPKGRQFQLVLPDGSKVWLNAASNIRYPVIFDRTERIVEINGEAYFEVASDKSWPFIVRTSEQQVQALGTSFNVNAYENEPAQATTLVEGSVMVKSHRAAVKSTQLKPGQQARQLKNSEQITVIDNQSEAATAWKNGYFNLENIPFEQVMKQLERWYDIEVSYENGVPDIQFVGGLSRQMKLDALIRTLQLSEVHFKMEAGRRLLVYK